MSNINLNLYKIFCVVAQSKSYSEASEKLNLSVANISTQISNLENQLNIRLFNREKNGVQLTESGNDLFEIINKSISNFDFAEKLVKQKNDIASGNIKIGCPSHLTSYYLMDHIEKAKNDYPNFKPTIICGADVSQMIELLKKHIIDFIIIDVIPDKNDNIVIEELKTINNILVSKAPLKINDIKELENLNYILNVENTKSTKDLMETLQKYNVKINVDMECDTTEIRVDAVKRNLGIGYVIKESVKKELEKEELYEVELPIKLPSIKLNLIYSKGELTKVDMDFIKKYLKN